MKSLNYDLEEERLKEEIRKRGAKCVLFQLPEGLKNEGPRLASIAEEAGALAIVSADPCYGACDLAVQEAQSLGADLLFHYGHSEMMPQQQVPIIYIEARATVGVKTAVNKALPLLKPWKRIGITTTVQHIDMLSEAREILWNAGKSVAIGDAGQLKYAGQIIGCNYSNATAVAKEVDAFLFVGGGRFHAIGIALATSKPTLVADPYEQRAYSIDEEAQKIMKQRWASINEAKKAERFGLLIGLKSGQKKIDETLRIKAKLEKIGRKTTLMSVREVIPEVLMEFPIIEAFVDTACPRISLDDISRFLKPVLTTNEALIIVGELTWEELCRRGWFED